MNITPPSGLVFEPLMVLAQTGVAGGSESGDPFWLSVGFGLGVLALILFAVEIFIPTAGMVGILCGISAVGSIIAFFQYSGSAGGLAILTYLIATPFLLVYGVKLWSQSPIGRRLILGGPMRWTPRVVMNKAWTPNSPPIAERPSPAKNR